MHLKLSFLFVLCQLAQVNMISYSEVVSQLQHQQNNYSTPENNSSLILAASRTRRRDLLHQFKYYNDGWNISDLHYWGSVGFTGVPLFIVALVWFGGFGLCIVMFHFCHQKPIPHYQLAYTISFVMLIFFSVIATVGVGVLYSGQHDLDHNAKHIFKYIGNKADRTTNKLKSLPSHLSKARSLGVAGFTLGPDIQNRIETINTKIKSSIAKFAEKKDRDLHDMRRLFFIVKLCLIIVGMVMLLLISLGFVFSVLGWQSRVTILVLIGWILVAVMFILCGAFLVLQNAVADSCVAVGEWVQTPSLQTAMEDVMPCVDNATSSESLAQSKDVSSHLVNVINRLISNIANVDIPPSVGPPVFYNQSGSLVPLLCDPFQMNMTHKKCSSNEVDFYNAKEVWHKYVCRVSGSGSCTTVGRLSPDSFAQMSIVVDVSFALYLYTPFLVQLQECRFIKDTLTYIYQNNCPALKGVVELIYVAVTVATTATMFLVIVWIIYSRERRHHLYIKNNAHGQAG